MTSKFNTKFSNSNILRQKKQKFLFLALAIALNPIQGGKLIDLQDGICYLAELISNCFFEVNDVHILCFLGFLSLIRMVLVLLLECLKVCANFCHAHRGELIYFAKFLGTISSGEFNGKH